MPEKMTMNFAKEQDGESEILLEDIQGTEEFSKKKLAEDFKQFSFSFWKICK